MKVSIVIPTHNRCDLLPRAIKSVQNQSIHDVEIIVVSDGSTDETDSVIQKLKEKDDRIQYISYHPGKNGNYARNQGIKAATGDYVAFLDDDDEWLPEKLEEQIKVMENDESIGLVYTGVHIIYVDDKVEYSFSPHKYGNLSSDILLDNCIGSTSTVLVRRKIFEMSGMFDEKLPALQDFELWIRICQCSNIGVVSKELVNYYNYRNTKQVSSSTERYEEAFKYIEEKYTTEISQLNPNEKKTRLCNKFFLLGNKAMRNNNPALARYHFKALLRERFSIKATLYYILTFANFESVLKLRSLKK